MMQAKRAVLFLSIMLLCTTVQPVRAVNPWWVAARLLFYGTEASAGVSILSYTTLGCCFYGVASAISRSADQGPSTRADRCKAITLALVATAVGGGLVGHGLYGIGSVIAHP